MKKFAYLLMLTVLTFYISSCQKQQTSSLYAIVIVGDYGQSYQKQLIAKNLKDYVKKYGLSNKYKIFVLSSLMDCNCKKFAKVFIINPKTVEITQNLYKDKFYCINATALSVVMFKIFENGKIIYETLETAKVNDKRCNDYLYPEINEKSLKVKALNKISKKLIEKIF